MHKYWTMLKERVRGERGRNLLFWISFFEGLFIPLPTEPFLAAAVAAERRRWAQLALVTTGASFLGACVAYLLGFFAFGLLEPFLGRMHDVTRVFLFVAEQAETHAFLISFAASFSFIPFTPLIVLLGFLGANPAAFLIASLLGRIIRFFAAAYFVRVYGERVARKEERLLAIGVGVFLALAILWGTCAASTHPLFVPGNTAHIRAEYSDILRVLHERHILPEFLWHPQ